MIGDKARERKLILNQPQMNLQAKSQGKYDIPPNDINILIWFLNLFLSSVASTAPCEGSLVMKIWASYPVSKSARLKGHGDAFKDQSQA